MSQVLHSIDHLSLKVVLVLKPSYLNDIDSIFLFKTTVQQCPENKKSTPHCHGWEASILKTVKDKKGEILTSSFVHFCFSTFFIQRRIKQLLSWFIIFCLRFYSIVYIRTCVFCSTYYILWCASERLITWFDTLYLAKLTTTLTM